MLFLVLCLYISIYYIRPFEWIEPFRSFNGFLYLSIVAVISLIIAWFNGRIKLFKFKTDIMVLGFTVAIALSHLSHGYVWGAINSITDFLPAIICYFLVAYSIDSEKRLKMFIVLLIGLSLFLSYEAYLQSAKGISDGGLEPLIQYGENADGSQTSFLRVRWFGPFNDPNDLGLALILAVPFLLNMFFNKRYLVSCLCLPPLLYGLFLTNSRGAMLALIMSVMVYLVLRYKSFMGVCISLAMVSLIILLGPSRLGMMSGSEESAYGRIEAWYAGFQMFKSYPLFGVGKGMFTEYHYLTAHNSYILVLSELGTFGSFFFLGMFFFPFRWTKSFIWDSELPEDGGQNRYLISAGIGSLIGLMTAMFFLSRSYTFFPYMCVGLVIATFNVFLQQSNEAVKSWQSEGYHLTTIGVLVIAQIIFINLMVKVLI